MCLSLSQNLASKKRNEAARATFPIWGHFHTFHWEAHPFVTMSQTNKVIIMSRSSSCLTTLTLCLLAHAGLASAQQQQTPPSDKPPKLERIEPGSDVPATTIPPQGRTRIIEKKANGGQVTEVQVTSGKSHYVVRPNNPPGNAVPGSAESGSVGAPQWKVLDFDLNRKRKEGAVEGPAEGGEAAPGAATAPPPPEPTTMRK
jgi:hypothetical protein